MKDGLMVTRRSLRGSCHRPTPWLKTDPRPVENGGDGLQSSVRVSARPPRRPHWNGIAVYASVQGVVFGLLAIGYGAISHDAGEQFAGLFLLTTGLLCAWYSRRRRPKDTPGPLRRPSFRFRRPPRRPLAMWLWVVAAWCAVGLSAIATSPAVEVGSILAVWGCIFAVAIVEIRS
jgi:hypothetical protein